MEPKHPDVTVQLTGQDGNAFAVMGAVAKGLRVAGYGVEVAAYMAEATSGDYDNLLRVSMAWVDVQ